jgi:hypothetical protein
VSGRAATVEQALCYDDSMAEVVSPRTAKSPAGKPRRKHTFVPATAEQISKGVGVTKKDAALVRKVLLRLGYIHEERPPQGKARKQTKAKQG